MDILVMFFLLIIIQINTQGDLDRFSSTNHRQSLDPWNTQKHAIYYMCEKPISPNGNEKDRERERARGHLSCVAVRDTVARQRHGGRLDRETSSPGTTAPGVSHRRGGGGSD